MRTGAEILVNALKNQGTNIIFGVPGESYLSVLDAFLDSPKQSFIVCRQEGGAAMMADAYGKLTGKPGICFVTRGPGATNASAGVHIACQDSTPMILLIGQVSRDQADREAFQEIDYRQMYAPLAKWVAQIETTSRIPEYISRAYHIATSGRPGPVVIALPEDLLQEKVLVDDIPPYTTQGTYPSKTQMKVFSATLSKAKRPLVIVGGEGWDSDACSKLEQFATTWNIPVATSFRAQDRINNNNTNYVGDVGIGINPKLAQNIKHADLIICIGARLGEITTSNYTLIKNSSSTQKLVHIYSQEEELGRVYVPYLGIHAGVKQFLEMAVSLSILPGKWNEWTSSTRTDYVSWSEYATKTPGKLNLGNIIIWLRNNIPHDSIICNGAGNFSAWLHRFYRYPIYRTQLAPTSGSMGYSVPAAVSAKLLNPMRHVIAITGDGDFMMHGQEFATAMKYGLNIIVILINNNMYGTIRMHQERTYPGRISGTNLYNPDFSKLAQSYGGYGECVEETDAFPGAYERALDAKRPAIIELKTDPQAITPNLVLSNM